ncbi:hypothetical protein GCM10023185_46440 [Hymenobacter saemangeumensis]|uniref:Uncharacterized protein n=1 Tax=Hymenobacter saemangeumensis TaxID=1084522 RepID=A0ABP8ISX3_9BACT
MKIAKTLAVALLSLLSYSSFAQSMDMKSGKLDFLKGQKNINIVYTYDNMMVGKGTEQDYVDKKVSEHNQKEAGKGDTWKKNWLGAREQRYQPEFEELLNKRLEDAGVKAGKFPDAPYTLILKTTFTEPGFNVGVMRMPAYTNMEAVFVKTGTTNPEAVIAMTKSPGRDAMGYDFDAGSRISESYAKAGKSLGAFLVKKKAF